MNLFLILSSACVHFTTSITSDNQMKTNTPSFTQFQCYLINIFCFFFFIFFLTSVMHHYVVCYFLNTHLRGAQKNKQIWLQSHVDTCRRQIFEKKLTNFELVSNGCEPFKIEVNECTFTCQLFCMCPIGRAEIKKWDVRRGGN